MTTKASKYGLRAAAADRTKKHAQRTPLPPKKGSPGAEAIAEKALAPTETNDDPKSWGKAAAFAALAAAAEWEHQTEEVAGAVQLTATRGAETIVQAWRGGVWQYDASVYAYGDRTTKPRNASGASKLLSRTPEDARSEANKVASNKHFRKAEPKDITTKLEDARRALPFDPGLATDEEILTAVRGQAIVWYNRLSRNTESAIVGRGKGMRMTQLDDGQRVLNFCCPATGYRSCLVTAILKVGRGRALTRGESNARGGVQEVEVA